MYKHNIALTKNKSWTATITFLAVLWGFLLPSSFSEAASDDSPRQGGTYRAPLPNEPASLDPALFTDIYSMNIANNLYDGLVKFDKDLNVRPAIAKRWKIARDYRTYTFELRKGVRFHNGREVEAADFVNSFSRN